MISILTTVYNGYEFLSECAKSVVTQKDDYAGLEFTWEWWIGINGHGEGGEALRLAKGLEALDSRIHVINLPDVRGRTAALNALKGMARGDWIAILDCDDIWEQDKLTTQVAAIRMSPKPIDVIGTHCSYFGEHSGSPRLPSGWIRPEDVRAGNPLINSSVLIRADLAVWEDRFGLEDYDLWIRLSSLGKGMFNVPHALVRHRVHGQSAFNGKGGQDKDALKAYHGIEDKRPTVVTAYYPIRSKYSIQEYMKWILQFWPQIRCNLVFYTDPALVNAFESAFQGRNFTRVIGIPFSELRAFNKLSPMVWTSAHTLDSEVGHTPELYALWYEKKEFVLRAIELNPFGSEKFVWCDAGIGRYPEWIPRLSSFPLERCIPCEKMLVLEIDPFKEEDFVPDENGIRGKFDTRATFGGGILASDIGGWNQWSKAYDAMLMRYYLAGRFVGKDQNIFASMILENPELAILVKRPMELGPIAGWFYLLFFLSG
jgi:glycosyltransferase involved in cell wall biosynthesis